jgi:hypothetical protein
VEAPQIISDEVIAPEVAEPVVKGPGLMSRLADSFRNLMKDEELEDYKRDRE